MISPSTPPLSLVLFTKRRAHFFIEGVYDSVISDIISEIKNDTTSSQNNGRVSMLESRNDSICKEFRIV